MKQNLCKWAYILGPDVETYGKYGLIIDVMDNDWYIVDIDCRIVLIKKTWIVFIV